MVSMASMMYLDHYLSNNILEQQAFEKQTLIEDPLMSDACFAYDDLDIPSMKLAPLALVETLTVAVHASVIATS